MGYYFHTLTESHPWHLVAQFKFAAVLILQVKHTLGSKLKGKECGRVRPVRTRLYRVHFPWEMGSIPLRSRLTLNFPRERHAGCSKTGTQWTRPTWGMSWQGPRKVTLVLGLPVWQKYDSWGVGGAVGKGTEVRNQGLRQKSSLGILNL